MMNATPIKDKGLSLKLDGYVRLRVSIGGPYLWYDEYQRQFLEKLGKFLPRMEYDPAENAVLVSMMDDAGHEVMNTSADAGSPPELPLDALKELCTCLAELQDDVKGAAANADRRAAFQAFRLPNPTLEPDMYRVYGRKKDKLAIIWGMEKNAGTSLTVAEFEAMVKEREGIKTKKSNGGKWLAALLLLAAAGLGAYLCMRNTTPQPHEVVPTVVPAESAVEAVVNKAVYKLHIRKGEEEIAMATAFAIDSNGTMVTADSALSHFGEEGVSCTLESADGKTYPVKKTILRDAEHDLAVIKTEAEELPFLRLRVNDIPARGEYIYILGYQKGAEQYCLTTGRVTSVEDNNKVFLHDAEMNSGSFGSPVVDIKGQVMGVVMSNADAEEVRKAVWVGALVSSSLHLPESGSLELPANVETKTIQTVPETSAEGDNGELIKQVTEPKTTEAPAETATPEVKPETPATAEPTEPKTTEAPAETATPEVKPETPATAEPTEPKATEAPAETATPEVKPETPATAEPTEPKTTEAPAETATPEVKPETPATAEPTEPKTTEAPAETTTPEVKPETVETEKGASVEEIVASAKPESVASSSRSSVREDVSENVETPPVLESLKKDKAEAAAVAEEARTAAKSGKPSLAREAAEKAKRIADSVKKKLAELWEKAFKSGSPEDRLVALQAEKEAEEAVKHAENAQTIANLVDAPQPREVDELESETVELTVEEKPEPIEDHPDVADIRKSTTEVLTAVESAQAAADEDKPSVAREAAEKARRLAEEIKARAAALWDKARLSKNLEDRKAAIEAAKHAAKAAQNAEQAEKIAANPAAAKKSPAATPNKVNSTSEAGKPAEAAPSDSSFMQSLSDSLKKGREEIARKVEDTRNAAKDFLPSKAQEAADKAKSLAEELREKARNMIKAALESGNADDLQKAKEAEKAAIEVNKQADEAQAVADEVSRQEAMKKNAEESATTAQQAADKAENALQRTKEARADGNLAAAKQACRDAWKAMKEAINNAWGSKLKADATNAPSDRKAAEVAAAAAAQAKAASDAAAQELAAADPQTAVLDSADDAKQAESAVQETAIAVRAQKPEEAEKAVANAIEKANAADNKAAGAERKAKETKNAEDIQASVEIRRNAVNAARHAANAVRYLPRKVSISAQGGFVARVVKHETNDDGTEHVVIHVDSVNVEEATVMGKKVDVDNNVEIDIPAEGEEVPYSIKLKGAKHPTSGGLLIKVDKIEKVK